MKTRSVLAIAAQVVVVAATAWAIAGFFTAGGEGNMKVVGWLAFRYFTVDSNVLAAIACVVCIPFEIRALRAPAGKSAGRDARTGADCGAGGLVLPHGVLILNFVGTVAVSVTFVVVVAFLGPVYGYASMFTGKNFFLHGVNPILCIVAFMALIEGPVRLRETLWCLLPVAIYGIVYCIEVVGIGIEAGGWPDLYGFNIGGIWYVWFMAIGLMAFILALIERLPHRRA